MAEILYPFGLDVHGSVAATSDPNVQQMQHVDSLVSTYPGERVMRPTYGIPLRDYVFEPGPDFVSNELQRNVTLAVGQWEPTVQVTQVTPVLDEDTQGVVSIDVDFNSSNSASNAPVHTATVYVGGSVTTT
jgi:phage baseplate assembly protein W